MRLLQPMTCACSRRASAAAGFGRVWGRAHTLPGRPRWCAASCARPGRRPEHL